MDKKEISGEIRIYLEVNKNENTTYQNSWDAAKMMVRGKLHNGILHSRKKEGAPTLRNSMVGNREC